MEPLEEALNWDVCLALTWGTSQIGVHDLHWIDEEARAQKGQVPYSPSLSWGKVGPGWNPRLSQAPQHTLLLKTA